MDYGTAVAVAGSSAASVFFIGRWVCVVIVHRLFYLDLSLKIVLYKNVENLAWLMCWPQAVVSIMVTLDALGGIRHCNTASTAI